MELFKSIVNWCSQPAIYISLCTVGFVLLISRYRVLSRPSVLWGLAVGIALFFIVGAQDEDFLKIITKGDNMPIVIMIFAILATLGMALRQAAVNDMRLERGLPPTEAEDRGKVLVWPDLVYSEFICTILLSALFIAWSVAVEAPMEEPASGTRAPNPAKAPWYFLGLQEMLVYFDPWLAGVVFPGLIVVGLMVIPYIDTNPKGNGYYTLKERKFAISMFLFGFLVLWVALVILGTFLRGPNWNFFAPFDYWDPHKIEPLVNINLSELVWVKWIGTKLPDNILIREAPGIVIILAYFAITPALLAMKGMKRFYEEMGFARYSILVMLLLCMAALPIKMLLRWFINLKYLVAIPEWFFNI